MEIKFHQSFHFTKQISTDLDEKIVIQVKAHKVDEIVEGATYD